MENDLDGVEAFQSVEELARCLIDATRQGRPIIPIVGSGISANSGFPVLVSIIRYFGKLENLIHKDLWLPASDPSTDPLKDLRKAYKDDPWKYVRDFGWPDRFQLNEDLMTGTARSASGAMNAAVISGLEQMLQTAEARRWKALDNLKQTIKNEIATLKKRSDGDRVWQAEFDGLQTRLLDSLQHNDWGGSVAWDLLGEWKKMILDFTRFQGQYADALLARFAQHRTSNLAHRYLAFLIRRLGIPVVFTLNFDPFIEQTFDEEGLRPRTFAMEHGLTLPHTALVREQLAVIKMHGSTHALLLDEHLDRPLDPEYLASFAEIVGEDPLLLVIGCSGDDRRLRDLIRQACSPDRNPPRLSVLWLHFEPEPASWLGCYSKSQYLKFRRTRDLSGTLMHIYSAIDHLHPSSRLRYLTHFQRPILLPDTERRADGKWKLSKDDPRSKGMRDELYEAMKKKSKFIILNSVPLDVKDGVKFQEECVEQTASRQLLLAGSFLAPGYNLIWVDLEALHTLSAVAGSIIDQCREFDSTLAPCVLPLDDDDGDQRRVNSIVRHAAEKVARALRRSRYFVAFDGMETYTWSPTAHHGETHTVPREKSRNRLKALTGFLIDLSNADTGESRFAVSVDPPRNRTPGAKEKPEPSLEDLRDQIGRLQNDLVGPVTVSRTNGKRIILKNFFGDLEKGGLRTVRSWTGPEAPCWALALSVMATYRRTRPLALVHQVLQPILGSAEMVEGFIHATQEQGVLCQIEGGGVLFYRELRDEVYASNTRGTDAESLRCFLKNASPSTAELPETVFQLLLNAFTHQLVARSWYAGAFIQSHDAFALLEYFYHRLASVRTLTKLIALLDHKQLSFPVGPTPGVSYFCEAVKKAKFVDELWDAFEQPNDLETFKKIERNDLKEKLLVLHREGLHRLRLAWQRSESELRAQVPAEQLIRWCEQFLNDDLNYRCDKVVIRYSPTGHSIHDIACLHPESDSARALHQLRAHIKDFEVKVRLDRSDYEYKQWWEPWIKATRGKYHGRTVRSIKSESGKTRSANEPLELSEAMRDQTQHLLDLLVCDVRKTQEETIDVLDLKTKMDRHAKRLEKWGGLLKPFVEAPDRSKIHEIELRRLHLLSNVYLGQVSVFSHGGNEKGRTTLNPRPDVFAHGTFSGALDAELPGFDQRKSKDTISKGSRLARLQSEPQTCSPRSTIVNAVADGTLYLQYRAIFTIQDARWGWMAAVNDAAEPLQAHSDPRRPEINAHKNPAEAANYLLAKVDESLRKFENARAGLADTNHLTLALADLHAVEACLAHARILLYPGNDLPKSESTDCFKLARSRYETARGLLARASTSLTAGQRNVVWWRLFFQLTSQYHSDRLMLELMNLLRGGGKLFESPKTSAGPSDDELDDALPVFKIGSRLLRLRKGYESLRNGYDLHLYHEKHEMKAILIWLPRLGWELTLCGIAIAVAAWRLRYAVRGEPCYADFDVQLNWLARTAGLSLGKKIADEGDTIMEAIKSLVPKYPCDDETIKKVRRDLIEMSARYAFKGQSALDF